MGKKNGLAATDPDLEGLVVTYGQNRRWFLKATIIVLILIIAAGIWFLKRGQDTPPKTTPGKKAAPTELPRMANLPPPEPKLVPPTPSYGPNAPVIEQARKALRASILRVPSPFQKFCRRARNGLMRPFSCWNMLPKQGTPRPP